MLLTNLKSFRSLNEDRRLTKRIPRQLFSKAENFSYIKFFSKALPISHLFHI